MIDLLVPTREQIYSLDDCAERPLPIPQWTAADGTPRGVWIRALTFKERMQAEAEALKRGREGEPNPWLLVAYEVSNGVTRPANISPDTILTWNSDVVEYIHTNILRLGGLSGAILQAELARLAGRTAPPEPGAVAGGTDPHPVDVGKRAHAPPGPTAPPD